MRTIPPHSHILPTASVKLSSPLVGWEGGKVGPHMLPHLRWPVLQRQLHLEGQHRLLQGKAGAKVCQDQHKVPLAVLVHQQILSCRRNRTQTARAQSSHTHIPHCPFQNSSSVETRQILQPQANIKPGQKQDWHCTKVQLHFHPPPRVQAVQDLCVCVHARLEEVSNPDQVWTEIRLTLCKGMTSFSPLHAELDSMLIFYARLEAGDKPRSRLY